MNSKSNPWLIYTFLILIFCGTLAAVFYFGSRIDALAPASLSSIAESPASFFHKHMSSSLGLFLVQIIVIFPAAQIMGNLFKKFGQPSVVGQITGGILLGPSILGTISPAAYQFIFPPDSLWTLRLMSHIGILLFMFVIGMELNIGMFRKSAHRTVLISHAGIVVPFALGCGLAVFLFDRYKGENASFESFALFLGIAMSVTAFPVLARILKEKNIAHTAIGTTALAAAAIDDVSAWTLLAFIAAVAESSSGMAVLYTIGFFGVFLAVMIFAVRPFLQHKFRSNDDPDENKIALVLWLVFVAALFTESIGIHALFGAFVAGVVMPDSSKFKQFLSERLEYFSSAFLLPLFFAVVGVRTAVGTLNSPTAWLVFILILAVAILGKFGGTSFAARYSGMTWKDSFAIGSLMNSRGLMELIVLNLGYEMGIFSERIFTKLVLMALVTTLMTGPLLSFFYKEQIPGRTRTA
jgi:Kef-type K+ transport system membrane component KefB